MLCCHCKKNQATKTYERITDGKKQTEYYCLDCYNRLFISINSNDDDSSQNGQIKVCPYCGTTSEEFKNSGMVGCPKCYKNLSNVVLPYVIKVQGEKAHCGKTPVLLNIKETKIKQDNLKKFYLEKIEQYKFENKQKLVESYKEMLENLKNNNGGERNYERRN